MLRCLTAYIIWLPDFSSIAIVSAKSHPVCENLDRHGLGLLGVANLFFPNTAKHCVPQNLPRALVAPPEDAFAPPTTSSEAFAC